MGVNENERGQLYFHCREMQKVEGSFFGITLSPFNEFSACSRPQSSPKRFSSLFPEVLSGALGNRGGLPSIPSERGPAAVTSCPQARGELPADVFFHPPTC